ncbi:TPA: phosphatase PAP2 family protein [Candidatus Woesearchaeota archaeon]|nr:phosphatase PAP2 family protein [Candidatus Woesearchaeota archaeon]
MRNSRLFFHAVSLIGLPPAYIVVLLFLWRSGFEHAGRIGMAFIAIEILCGAIKLVYPKERPEKMPRRNLIERYEAGGFPSIHSARAAALAIGTGAAYPMMTVWVLSALAAAVVGYSRVYLKKHDITDVLGGMAIAVVISALALTL